MKLLKVFFSDYGVLILHGERPTVSPVIRLDPHSLNQVDNIAFWQLVLEIEQNDKADLCPVLRPTTNGGVLFYSDYYQHDDQHAHSLGWMHSQTLYLFFSVLAVLFYLHC